MTLFMTFWTWYSGLFSDSDNKVRIAAASATIALISFVLTFIVKPLFSYTRGKLSKVKVEAGITHQLIESALYTEPQAGLPLLTCTVTNHSSKSIYIHNPSIKVSRKINGANLFSVPKEKGTFPMKLESEQQTKIEYQTADLKSQLLEHLKEKDKVSFVVMTSTGKKYYSNKFTKKFITEHMQVAKDLNKA
jgi:hypothetical protein